MSVNLWGNKQDTAPAELYYNEEGAAKYHQNTRIREIQRTMSERYGGERTTVHIDVLFAPSSFVVSQGSAVDGTSCWSSIASIGYWMR